MTGRRRRRPAATDVRLPPPPMRAHRRRRPGTRLPRPNNWRQRQHSRGRAKPQNAGSLVASGAVLTGKPGGERRAVLASPPATMEGLVHPSPAAEVRVINPPRRPLAPPRHLPRASPHQRHRHAPVACVARRQERWRRTAAVSANAADEETSSAPSRRRRRAATADARSSSPPTRHASAEA